MKSKLLSRMGMAAALAVFAGFAQAASKPAPPVPGSDADLSQRVRREVLMYPRYTMWDDIEYRVSNGQVELFGAVSQPYKKSDIERLVRQIPGVVSVTDQVTVLPLSTMDDRLRLQVARAIYRDPALSRYAMGAIPAIHIIVDNGHVTLVGVVQTAMDKEIAGMRANASLSFGPVINNLQVENPPHKS